MTELKPGDLQTDPQFDPTKKPLPEVRPVDAPPLKPVLIPDDIIRKGKEQELAERELDWRITHPGFSAISRDWWKYLSGGVGALMILKLIGC